jgi:hypothetical protein
MAIVALLMGGATGMTAFVISLFVFGLPLGASAQVYFATGAVTVLVVVLLRVTLKLRERASKAFAPRGVPAFSRRR